MAGPDRMHICQIITRLIVGGAQENTILTCRGLHEHGHRVTLITGPEAGPEGQLLEEARESGYEVILLDSMRRAVNPLMDRRCFHDLVAILRRIRPDIVHTHSSKAGILGRFAARQARVPHIVHTIHGMSFNRTQGWMQQAVYRFLEKQAARASDCLVTVADAMIEQATEAGIAPRSKFRTVYSGMQTDWFSPELYDRKAIRRSWGFTDEHVVVGAIARLFRNPEKTLHSARRLVMAVESPTNSFFSLLDRVGLDTLAVRMMIAVGSSDSLADIPVIAGVPELLGRLAGLYKLSTISTRSVKEQETLLGKLGLREYFNVLVGRDTTWRIKPHPEPVFHAARTLGVEPKRCLMVGDTTVDVLAGRRAGTWTCAVLCGYGERIELERARAHVIIQTTSDIDGILLDAVPSVSRTE